MISPTVCGLRPGWMALGRRGIHIAASRLVIKEFGDPNKVVEKEDFSLETNELRENEVIRSSNMQPSRLTHPFSPFLVPGSHSNDVLPDQPSRHQHDPGCVWSEATTALRSGKRRSWQSGDGW